MPFIFEFTDYRKFLEAYYIEKKAMRRRFSYQKFADKAGFKTKTFLFKVIHGEKALSKRSIPHVAKAIGLKKREGIYFDAMVNFNDAKKSKERERHFNRMRAFMRRGPNKILREFQYSYFSKWWHPVIRELVTTRNFKNDFKALAKATLPAIRPKQAKDSVKLLLALNLIKKAGAGKYTKTTNVVTTGDEVQSFAIQNFHRDALTLSAGAIDRVPRRAREISGAVLYISKKNVAVIKSEIQEFRKRLLHIAEHDRTADRVYLGHFSFFPLSKVRKTQW